jgi:FtsZ-binding cell division protein ZapB
LEAMNALRAGLAEVLGLELQSEFAMDTAQTLQMLIESLAAEWDTAAEDLRRDNETLEKLLKDLKDVLSTDGNSERDAIVDVIDETIGAPGGESLALTALSERNMQLRGALERAIVAVEDSPEDRRLAPLRSAVYSHLREVAGRGWSFWDMASFRDYMALRRSGER